MIDNQRYQLPPPPRRVAPKGSGNGSVKAWLGGLLFVKKIVCKGGIENKDKYYSCLYLFV